MRNTVKRILSLLIASALLMSLVSCGKDDVAADDGNDNGDNGSSVNAIGYPELINCAETLGNVKNVILIIGDGMGEAQLDAGELFYGVDFAFRDELAKFYSETNSLDKNGEATEVTDSAASATAMATGYLTANKHVAMTRDLVYLSTVLDLARECGKSTGVVTTDYLSGATPASFTAHTNNRNLDNKIIQSQIDSQVDLLIGRYNSLYDNYAKQIGEKYSYYTEFDRDAILADKTRDVLCNVEIETDAEDSVDLSFAADLAIDYLSADEDGFVLMIEQAYIDKHCSDSNIVGAAKAALSLAETVDLALEYARAAGDTAVIVTADHETSGLVISADSGAHPNKVSTPDGSEISYAFTNTYHTDTPVPVFVFGFTAHPELCPTYQSKDRIKNSEIFRFVQDLIVNS